MLACELVKVTSLLRFFARKMGLIIPDFQIYCENKLRWRVEGAQLLGRLTHNSSSLIDCC
jgi:hypothetical protein